MKKNFNIIKHLFILLIITFVVLVGIPSILNIYKLNDNDLDNFIVNNVKDLAATYTKYENGDEIYFNPVTGEVCEASDVVSTTGTRSGCMKWYAFNDSESSSTVDVILDHNTTSTCTYEEILTHLAGDTAKWKKNLNPRIITADEIAEIVGHTSWNSDTATTNDWFYLDSKTQTQVANASNPSSYAWLFNNLYQSKTYGGTKEDNNAYNYSYYNSTTSGSTAVATANMYGYWTANDVATDSARAWNVHREGILGNSYVSYARIHGVRPVITLSKSLLEGNSQNNKVYSAGTEILYNVSTGKKCTAPVSTTGTKSGCMKFYVIDTDDNNSRTRINVILDHNTTALTSYSAALTGVITDTSSWIVASKHNGSNGRLITVDEIATIVGHTSWNSATATSDDYFYLDGNDTDGWKNLIVNASNPSKYAWLYNNTNSCIEYGCTVEDSSNYGYWTSTLVSSNSSYAWHVYKYAYLGNSDVTTAHGYGIRPVITISKSVFD